ncbi:hypothetical protein BH10CYA1_BH10CYA1_34110 [soil metagenome]
MPDTEIPVTDPLIGTRLAGRFLIESALGSGGMSVVYKGKHESVDRTVAIKTLKLDLCSQPVLVSRFEREVKSLSRLNHPNIVTVYDCVISPQGQPYIIMDYVDGESLEQSLAKSPMSASRAAKLVVQVCSALDHAHRHGVIHRDLKPANIMLQSSNPAAEVKVLDFGLAKLAEDTQKLTQSDELWGSLPYMSPEQCSSNANIEIDLRADIYSLGAVLFQMLTGKDPFYGLDLMQTLDHHINEPPPSFREVAPERVFPPALEIVVRKALNKNREDRYQSMREFKEAIEGAAAQLLKEQEPSHVSANTSAKPPTKKPKRITKSMPTASKRKEKARLVRVVGITSGITIVCTIALIYCMVTLFKGSFIGFGTSLKTTASQTPTASTTPTSKSIPPVVPSPPLNPAPTLGTATHVVQTSVPVQSTTRRSASVSRVNPSLVPKIRSIKAPSAHKLTTHQVSKPSSSTVTPAVKKIPSTKSPWSTLESQRSSN